MSADPRTISDAAPVEAPKVERAPDSLTPRDSPLIAPVLLFEHVSKWYGPVLGVNQVTLELRSGITGLVGANGAGKSTLLRLATGQLRPDLGRVRVAGRKAWSWTAKRHVGYCPDSDVFYEEMSGVQFVEAIARLSGFSASAARERTTAALERVGMSDRASRRIRGYSKGMRQRVKLAAALIHDPKLLVLDEPLSGIDPIGRREFLDLFLSLAEQGKCLLISSHELDELEKLTDHVAIMARGRIAAVGTLARIRDLLDDHPLAVRIDSDRPRELAKMLLGLDDAVGVEIGDGNSVIARVLNPRRFFRAFTRLVLENDITIEHLEPLDDSAHAILGYLLGAGHR
jgi:ABC-2 type transport system ATP-binding protein